MRIAVVGAGVVGLAITYELIKAGQQVDCFEAAVPMSARSVGDTRIFRLAHDRPELVDCAAQAHRIWQAWSELAGVQLVGTQGTVASGRVETTAAAMEAAGAPFEIVDSCPDLPAANPEGPFLVDRGGGVIQAAATGHFLLSQVGDHVVAEGVTGIEVRGDTAVVRTAVGEHSYDSVVVAAGAGTSALMAALGIEVPGRLEQHVRVTFPLRDPGAVPPCWLDRSYTWRPDFSSYGQLSGPGRWALGGSLAAAETDMSYSSNEVIRRAAAVLSDYVRECVTGCDPNPVDHIYCTPTDLGDGVSSARVGPVLAIWGDNLFKLAPIIARSVGTAAIEESLPLAAVAHAGGATGT